MFCQVVNANYVYGVVVYTGEDSKVRRNSKNEKHPAKKSRMERMAEKGALLLPHLPLVPRVCVCMYVYHTHTHTHTQTPPSPTHTLITTEILVLVAFLLILSVSSAASSIMWEANNTGHFYLPIFNSNFEGLANFCIQSLIWFLLYYQLIPM